MLIASAVFPWPQGFGIGDHDRTARRSFIADRTNRQSAEVGQGAKAAPCHGEIIIAFEPSLIGAALGKARDGADASKISLLGSSNKAQGCRAHAATPLNPYQKAASAFPSHSMRKSSPCCTQAMYGGTRLVPCETMTFLCADSHRCHADHHTPRQLAALLALTSPRFLTSIVRDCAGDVVEGP